MKKYIYTFVLNIPRSLSICSVVMKYVVIATWTWAMYMLFR
jgi:hypothetical protein